jgi:Polyketide cyclase / dehydrase and lipid transport
MPHASATTTIDAPVELVWVVMLDLDAYVAWNPFIYRVDRAAGLSGRAAQPGERFTLRVRFRGGRAVASRERVTAIEAPARGQARLEYQFYGRLHHLGLVRGRRQQYLTSGPGQSTVYRTEETFTGPLRFLLPVRAVRDGFRRHAAALKAQAELLAAQG